MAEVQNHKGTGLEIPRLDHLRVLVIFGGTRLFGQERGNIEVFRAMAELGMKARFIVRKEPERSEVQSELDRLGFEWVAAPFGYHWGRYLLGREFYYFFVNLYGVVATSWRVWREARRWKPTHLYVMNTLYLSYALPAVLALHQPLVYRAGDVAPIHTAFHRWLCRRLFGRVSQMACISKFIMGDYQRTGMDPARMRVIYNHPPQRKSLANPPNLPARSGAAVILFIGQVAEFKGVGILVDAVRNLLRTGRDLELWIAGEAIWGSEFVSRIKSQIESEHLESRIRLLGYAKDVAPLFKCADIHVCPSICQEALGNVVVEAKSEGVPSVVFPDGGLPELIEHAVDGFVCRDCTTEALEEGLIYFLDRPEERTGAGIAARRSLEAKFGIERFRREWAEVFRNAKAGD